MRLAWNARLFPDWPQANTLGRLYDRHGQEIRLWTVAFDSETGEVWAQLRDMDNRPVIEHEHGCTVYIKVTCYAPLRFEPLDMAGERFFERPTGDGVCSVWSYEQLSQEEHARFHRPARG